MPIIDLSVDFEDVKDEDVFKTVANGDYEFTVTSGELGETQKGRPMLRWRLEVVDPVSGSKVKIPYSTVLPWMTPDGLDTGGVGLLVAFCKAVGKPWTGSKIDPDEYVGRSGRATIVQKPGRMQNADGEWVSDPDTKVNDVKKFIYS